MAEETRSTSSGGDLFRREALEHRARQKGPGDVVRVAAPWVTVAFYSLLVLFAAAVVAGTVVEIDRYAQGITANSPDGRLVVLLPATQAPDVPEGARVEIGAATGEVVSADGTVLTQIQVWNRFGVEVQVPSVVAVTTVEGVSGGGSARVLIERQPVIVALIPGLQSLFGDSDA